MMRTRRRSKEKQEEAGEEARSKRQQRDGGGGEEEREEGEEVCREVLRAEAGTGGTFKVPKISSTQKNSLLFGHSRGFRPLRYLKCRVGLRIRP